MFFGGDHEAFRGRDFAQARVLKQAGVDIRGLKHGIGLQDSGPITHRSVSTKT